MTEATARRDASARQPPPLRISRAFPAPRALLFRAWGSGDPVKRWFSPETFTAPHAEVQMRVGGPFNVRLRGPYGQERLVRGTFVEVVPHDRLVIDMTVADAEGKRLFKAYTEVTFPTMGSAFGWTWCRPMLSSIRPWPPRWARPKAGGPPSISSRRRWRGCGVGGPVCRARDIPPRAHF